MIVLNAKRYIITILIIMDSIIGNLSRTRRAGIIAITAGALLSAATSAVVSTAEAADIRATDIRIGAHVDKTRFVIDLSESVGYSVFSLLDPYRIVIDLPEIGWKLPRKPARRRIGLVSSFKYGQYRAGSSRVVLKVAKPSKVRKAFLLPPAEGKRYRLVVDLVETDHKSMRADARSKKHETVARADPSLQRGPPGRKPNLSGKARKVIIIDPGHGGIDPGATGHSGIFEKHITLAVARDIKRHLSSLGRYTVHLTRNKDRFIRLRNRIAIARAKGADLFISLHADAIKGRKIRGLSVYTLSEKASDKEAAALAEKENKADLIGGMDLSENSQEVTSILIDLAQRESMNESSKFAAELVHQLKSISKMLPNSHRFAGFAVLKAPDVPSVLIELGFLSNPNDERALRDAKYRRKLAGALGHAVDSYFERVEQAHRN